MSRDPAAVTCPICGQPGTRAYQAAHPNGDPPARWYVLHARTVIMSDVCVLHARTWRAPAGTTPTTPNEGTTGQGTLF